MNTFRTTALLGRMAIFSVLVACSAAHKGTPEPATPVAQNSFTENETSLGLLLSDESLGIEKDPQGEAILAEAKTYLEMVHSSNVKRPLESFCRQSSESVICQGLNRQRWKWPPLENSESAGGINVRQARKSLMAQKFADLGPLSLGQVIKLGKTLPKSQLISVADELAKVETCQSSALYMGLGANLDSYFAEPEAASLAKQVFAKALTCHTDEVAVRAGFRLAMMFVLEDNCAASLPILDQLASNPAALPLGQRVRFWQTKCKSSAPGSATASAGEAESKDRNLAAATEISAGVAAEVATTDVESENTPDGKWPLTYHGILLKKTPALASVKSTDSQIQIQYRSGKPEFDSLVQAAEAFLKFERADLARGILEKINLDALTSEDPKFQLYVSALFNRSQSGLGTFRVMSRLFVREPQLKNELTLKLYYPTWYLTEVRAVATEFDIDPFLLLSIIRQESAFNRLARSGRGAKGLMQLLPGTARLMGLKQSEDLQDVEPNVRSGAKFFRHLLNRFDGKVHLALAAYNAGPGAVNDWLKRYKTDDDTLFMDLIPFRETRDYTANILRNWHWYKALYAPVENEVPSLAASDSNR